MEKLYAMKGIVCLLCMCVSNSESTVIHQGMAGLSTPSGIVFDSVGQELCRGKAVSSQHMSYSWKKILGSQESYAGEEKVAGESVTEEATGTLT
jgi:hypothetical protein